MQKAETAEVNKQKERAARLLAKGDHAGAAEALEALARLEPRNDRWRLKLAEVLRKQGRKEEALRAYKAVADFYADNGFLVRAISVNKIILEMAPQDREIHNKLALLYAKRGVSGQRTTDGDGLGVELGALGASIPGATGGAAGAAATLRAGATSAASIRGGTPRMPEASRPATAGAGPAAGLHQRAREAAIFSATEIEFDVGEVVTHIYENPPAAPVATRRDGAPLHAPAPAPAAPPPPPTPAPTPAAESAAPGPGLRVRPTPAAGPGSAPPAAPSGAPVTGRDSAPVTAPRAPAPPPPPPATGLFAAPPAFSIRPQALGGPPVPPPAPETEIAGIEVHFDEPTGDDTGQHIIESLDGIDVAGMDLEGVSVSTGAASLPKMPYTPLFSELAPSELGRVMEVLVPHEVAEGGVICRAGDAGDSIFIIGDGSVKVSSVDEHGAPLWLTNLGEGELFGEFGFFSDARRHASVTALTDCTLLEIRRDDMKAIAREYPRVQNVLVDLYKKRVLDMLFARSEVFRSLDVDARRQLITGCKLVMYPKGRALIREQRNGEAFFVIKSGKVDVVAHAGESAVTLASLGAGDFVGEISLITGSPTTADVVAVTDVVVARFARAEIEAIAGMYPEVAKVLRQVSIARTRQTVSKLAQEGLV